jgi:uncharacterized membrane protein YfcA
LSALKNLAAAGIELLVVAYFASSGLIAWRGDIAAMVVGSGIGGVVGARWALKVPQQLVRTVIVLAGVALALLAAVRAYALH